MSKQKDEIKWSELTHFTPKQKEANDAFKNYKYVLYGGALGGGKSYWLRWTTLEFLLRQAKKTGLKGIRAALFCEDYPSLKDRHISKIQYEFPQWLGTLNKADHEFVIKPEYGGGVLALRNLDDPSKYASSEFALIAVDELTKNPKEVFDHLRTRLRWPKLTDVKFIAGTNPGSIGHCVPYGEVLTKKGWKSIKDIKVGEQVMTQDFKNNLVFVPVSQVIKEQYDGELLESKGNTARFVCTPNHKIARVTETKNKKGRTYHDISLIEAQKMSGVTRLPKLGKWVGKEIKIFKIPPIKTRKLRLQQPDTLTGDQYCALMGWFLSEGHTVSRDKAFGIAQTKLHNRALIRELLIDCGFKFGETKTSFLIHSPKWFKYLSQFGKCRDKFVPEIIKDATPEQLMIFWKAIMAGDGNGIHYFTISKQLAEDMEEVGLKLGFKTYGSSRQRLNRRGLSYEISFKKNRLGWIDKRKIVKKKFSGEVYCLGIPKLHRFFLRQNGNVWLSGNSWVKKIWLDKQFEEGEIEADQFFYVPARAADNPHLDNKYYAQLVGLPEKLRKAFLEGRWDVFEGQVFTEWNPTRHILPKAPTTFEGRRKFICCDYGYVAPSAVYWCEINNDDKVIVYREFYGTGKRPEELAELIMKESAKEKIDYFVGDPSMWSKTGHTGRSIAETMEDWWRANKWHIPTMHGDNERIHGWQQVHEFLADAPDGKPWLLVSPTCVNLIRTLPMLIYDDKLTKREDVDSEGEDHAGDALRYGLMSRPKRPKSYIGLGDNSDVHHGLDTRPSFVMKEQGIMEKDLVFEKDYTSINIE